MKSLLKQPAFIVACVLMLCLVPLALFAGCGETKITSAIVKQGTLETTIARGETLDTTNTVVIVTWSDDTTEEVSGDVLSFSDIDTETVGAKTLVITYTYDENKTYDFNVTIQVVATEADVSAITSLSSQLLTDFTNNKAEKANKQEEFYDRTQPLYVGDDNAFNFRINANGIDGAGNLITKLERVRTEITVELKGDNPTTADVEADSTYTLLAGDDLARYVTIDTVNTALDFTEEAIGHTFRVRVTAANIAEGYAESACSFTAELSVIDGFNVYTAKELSVFDNHNSGYDAMKQALGLPSEVNGVVLQNNIQITADDVAQNLLWSESDNISSIQQNTDQEIIGTPKDSSGSGIYYREMTENGEFNFVGNYFSVDLSQFPKMVVEGSNGNQGGVNVAEGEIMTSHFSTFYVTNVSANTQFTEETALNFKNVYFIGNGELNSEPENSGAIILLKNTRTNFNAYNTVTQNFYIGYFMQLGADTTSEYTGEYVVDSCKGYNSYQCLFYAWGAEHLMIKDSEFIGAGGPAIIADHCEKSSTNDAASGYASNIDIINSNIESKITGQEPWFVSYGATELAMQLVSGGESLFDGSNEGLPATDKTIYAGRVGDNVPQINVVALLKSSSAEGLTNERIRGYVRIFDTLADYNKYYGLDGETADTSINYGLDMTLGDSLADRAMANDAHYFESSGNGGYINSGVAVNQDTSLASEQIIDGVYNGILAQLGGLGDMSSVAIGMFTIADYDNLEFADKQSQLIQKINTLVGMAGSLGDAVDLGQVADALYAGLSNYFTDENWSNYKGTQKVNAIVEFLGGLVDNYTTGDYLNIYVNNGMGIVLGLYPRDA